MECSCEATVSLAGTHAKVEKGKKMVKMCMRVKVKRKEWGNITFDKKPETEYMVGSEPTEGTWQRGTVTAPSYLTLILRPGSLGILTGGDTIPQAHVLERLLKHTHN